MKNQQKAKSRKPLRRSVRDFVGDIIQRAELPDKTDCLLRASVTLKPSTLNREDRTVEAIIATENPQIDLDRRTYRTVVGVLLASGMVPTKQVPLLDTHERFSQKGVLGSARGLMRSGNKIAATVHYSTVLDAEEAFTKVEEGHLTDYSIGAQILRSVDIQPGKTKTIQGQTYTAPEDMAMRVITRWRPREVSICAIGNDPDAINRHQNDGANGTPHTNGKESDMKTFNEWLLERGLGKAEDLDEVQRTALQKDYDDEVARSKADDSPPADKSPADDVQRAAGDDAQVINFEDAKETLKRAGREANAELLAEDVVRRDAIRELAGPDVSDDVITRCITDGLTVDLARAEVLKHVREHRPSISGPAIHTGGGELTRQMVEAGLCMREGLAGDAILRAYGEEVTNRADGACRDLSMVDLARTALTLARRDVPSDREELLRAAFTTNDLSLIFSNTGHLFVMAGFENAAQTWRDWCRIMPASDFKQHTGVRLAHNGRLKEVSGATGEIKHGKLVEEGEYYSIGTYAELLAITRKHFIDDALGLMNDTARLMGEEAMELLGDLVYTVLLANPAMRDGNALFHAAKHLNLNTSNALDDANLSTAKRKYRQQKNAGDRRINRPAKILLIPDELERTALKLLNSSQLIGYGGGTNTTEGENNVHYKTLAPVVEGRLSDTAFHAGASATSWYLAGGPSQGAIGMAFLNNQQTPTVTRFNPGPDYVAGGVMLQIFIDAGAAALEYRSAQKNTA